MDIYSCKTLTQPITIPKSTKKIITTFDYNSQIKNDNDSIFLNNDYYDLKQNVFDPTKNSPPNHWNSRLNNRIIKY